MSINPPQNFDWTVRNLHKAFNEWLEEVNLFLFEFQKFEGEGRDSATKAANVEKKKRSLFIYLFGKKDQQIYKTLTIKNAKGETIENDDEKKLEMVIEAFKDNYKPMKTLTVDRVEFLRKEQSKDESFEDYLLNLKSSSKDCEWNNVTENDMIKLQIIKGIHNKKRVKFSWGNQILPWHSVLTDAELQNKGRKKQYDCIYCQRSHVKGTRNCPAYGQECFRCKRKKHFAISRICKDKYSEQKVNECFHVVGETIHKVHANLKLNGKPIKFMIDSGTTVNVIPATFVKDNKMEHLLKKR